MEGIYYSEVTGRIFEATKKGKSIKIKYADNESPKTKEINLGYFMIQLELLGCYEPLIDYSDE
jgi:hypothetical protein